jgi:hypothetical protein
LKPKNDYDYLGGENLSILLKHHLHVFLLFNETMLLGILYITELQDNPKEQANSGVFGPEGMVEC